MWQIEDFNTFIPKLDPLDYPNTIIGLGYAHSVLSEPKKYNLYIQQLIQKFITDVKESLSDTSKYYFDWSKGERYLKYVQRFKHVKGANWISPYILYEPWQKFLFVYLMSAMRRDNNRRRFRNAFIMLPRGNGKSAISSQLALLLLS